MRNALLAKKCSGLGVCSKLCVTKKPLIAKNMNTPVRPRMHWLPVSRISHSRFCVPSAIRKECEKITAIAAKRRSASKLFCRPVIREYERTSAGCHSGAETVSSLAQTRIAFGKAISSYQGVKHQAADMLVAIENAKSLAYYAAWAVDQELDEAPLAVPLAP